MNIFHKVALQGLKKNRTQTFVTIVGVALSALMITAVATLGTSLLNYIENDSIDKYGNWHVEFVDVTSTFVQEQAARKEVANTTVFENIGYAMLEGVKSTEKPYLFISGFTDEAFDTLPITLVSGRLPENSSEVLIPFQLTTKGSVKISVGDTLTLGVGNRKIGAMKLTQHDPYDRVAEALVVTTEKTYTVVGLCSQPKFEEPSAPGYTLITKAEALNQADSFSLFVTLKNPQQVHSYTSTTSAKPYLLNNNVLRFMGVSDNKLFNTVFYTVGGILVAIIMTGSIFLIYNSFNISLNERTRPFGILMSVGATAKQLRNLVLFEGFCIGLVGIPIGALAGIGSVNLILPIVASNFNTIISSNVPLTLSVSVPALVLAAAFSLATILISAYIPARKAAATPVMECIRQTNEIKIESKAFKSSKLTQRIYGLEGTLALKNFRRNKKRYRSIVLSLTLSIVLFVSGNAFETTLKQIAKENTVKTDSDLLFYTQDMEEKGLFQLYDKLKTASGINKSTFQAKFTYPCTTSDLSNDLINTYQTTEDDSTGDTLKLPLVVQFLEDDLYYDFIKSLSLPIAEYTGPDAKVLIAGTDTLEPTTYFINSVKDFTVTSLSGEQSKTIRATFMDSYPSDTLPTDLTTSYPFIIVAPWQLKQQFDILRGAPESFTLKFWSENPSQTMAQIQSFTEEAGVTSNYTLLNLSTAIDLYQSGTFVLGFFTYVFIIMLSLIAIANVFNTISTNIRLRRRELAMLRSVGMSDQDFLKMMKFECVFYGIRTLLFGVPIAVFLSWLIHKVLVYKEKLYSISFLFPLRSMIISVLSVFFVVFITMQYAANKIRKENIVDALRDDMD